MATQYTLQWLVNFDDKEETGEFVINDLKATLVNIERVITDPYHEPATSFVLTIVPHEDR